MYLSHGPGQSMPAAASLDPKSMAKPSIGLPKPLPKRAHTQVRTTRLAPFAPNTIKRRPSPQWPNSLLDVNRLVHALVDPSGVFLSMLPAHATFAPHQV